jgi:hypothetical protein
MFIRFMAAAQALAKPVAQKASGTQTDITSTGTASGTQSQWHQKRVYIGEISELQINNKTGMSIIAKRFLAKQPSP